MIDTNKIQAQTKIRDNFKKINISIKISKNQSNWLKHKNYSPARILYEAFEELGFREGFLEPVTNPITGKKYYKKGDYK